MNSITEWMVENKIAENGFAAGHIAVGLQLYKYPREQQEAMCRLYRKWRSKTDKKMLPKRAYYLTIAGIDPEIELDPAMLQVIEQADEKEEEGVG